MRKLFKKVTAMTVALTMVAGLASVATAAVAKGTDVATGTKWTSYSVYTHETCLGSKEEYAGGKEKNCWYHSLTNNDDATQIQHYVDDKVTDAQLKAVNDAIKEANKKNGTKNPTMSKHAETWGEHNTYRCFGENAKITSQTASSFLMDVTSTGWSANWGPTGRDEEGNMVYEAIQSNPWGVDATKIVNVDRGRYYDISFKIKSTLQNEIMESEEREDGTGYNVPTGKFNYVKHIHFKAYDDKDESGAARQLINLKATQGGKSVLTTGHKTINKDFNSFIKLDSKNTADDGWVTVSARVLIPSEKEDWQGKAKQPTLGIKFAFGAYLVEFPDENDMSGTIEVKDFKVVAAETAKKPAKAKISKVSSTKKKTMVVKFKKAKKAKKYEVQYSLKANFKKAKIKTTKKTTLTVKKLKSKKKYYVRVRGFYTQNGSKICGPWSKKKTVKVK